MTISPGETVDSKAVRTRLDQLDAEGSSTWMADTEPRTSAAPTR